MYESREVSCQCVAVCCRVLQCIAECCSVLQCVAVCCSVLQFVAVCCSVLQCVAVCCSVSQCVAVWCSVLQCVAVYRSASQCAAVCCSVLQCVAVCCSVLQCVAMCCNVLQCVAVCCSVLQCVAVQFASDIMSQAPTSPNWTFALCRELAAVPYGGIKPMTQRSWMSACRTAVKNPPRVWRSGVGFLAVCCSVLQRVAEFCSGQLHGNAAKHSPRVWRSEAGCFLVSQSVVLQHVAVCCGVLQWMSAVHCGKNPLRMLRSCVNFFAMCGSVFHYFADCWSEWARGTLQRKTRQGCGQME